MDIDFPALMKSVALRLLGEPNRKLSKAREWRYGAHGSLRVDLVRGRFDDFEYGVSGGVLDLIEYKVGCDRAGAFEWLKREGLWLE